MVGAGAGLCMALSRSQHQCGRSARRGRAKRTEDKLDPLAEYQAAKSDPVVAWVFAEKDEEAYGPMATVFGVCLIPAAFIASSIFPFTAEGSGEILPRNILATTLFSTGVALIPVLAVIIIAAFRLVEVNKLLRQNSFVVEVDPVTGDQSSGTGGYYTKLQTKNQDDVKRDRLVSDYSTEPALARLRVVLGAWAAASAVAWIGGTSAGGEVRMAPEELSELDEEDDPGARDMSKCGAGCVPGVGSKVGRITWW